MLMLCNWLRNSFCSYRPSSKLQILQEKGVTNKDLLANHSQHLLQISLTAPDMNICCPANSSTHVAGQFPCQTYLQVFTQSAKAQAEVRAGQVSKSLETSYLCQQS